MSRGTGGTIVLPLIPARHGGAAVAAVLAMAVPCIAIGVATATAIAIPASASRRDGFAVHMAWRTAGTVVLPLIPARRHVAVAIVFAMAVPCIATGVAIAVSASAARRHGL